MIPRHKPFFVCYIFIFRVGPFLPSRLRIRICPPYRQQGFMNIEREKIRYELFFCLNMKFRILKDLRLRDLWLVLRIFSEILSLWFQNPLSSCIAGDRLWRRYNEDSDECDAALVNIPYWLINSETGRIKEIKGLLFILEESNILIVFLCCILFLYVSS